MDYIYSDQEIVWIRKLAESYSRGQANGSITMTPEDQEAIGVEPDNIVAVMQTLADHGLIHHPIHTSAGQFTFFTIHANIVQVLRRIEAEEKARMHAERMEQIARESNERREQAQREWQREQTIDQRQWQEGETRKNRRFQIVSGCVLALFGFILGQFKPMSPPAPPAPVTVVVPDDAIQKAK